MLVLDINLWLLQLFQQYLAAGLATFISTYWIVFLLVGAFFLLVPKAIVKFMGVIILVLPFATYFGLIR